MFCVRISFILLLIKWSEMDPNVKPQTLVETFDQANYNSILEYNVSSHNFVDLSCVNMHSWAELLRYEDAANSFTKDHNRRGSELSCNSAHTQAQGCTVKPVLSRHPLLSGQLSQVPKLISLIFTLNETFIKWTPLLSGRGHLKSTWNGHFYCCQPVLNRQLL